MQISHYIAHAILTLVLRGAGLVLADLLRILFLRPSIVSIPAMNFLVFNRSVSLLMYLTKINHYLPSSDPPEVEPLDLQLHVRPALL